MHRTRRTKGKGKEKGKVGEKGEGWEKKKGKIDIAVLGRFPLMPSIVIARGMSLKFLSLRQGGPKSGSADLVPKNPHPNLAHWRCLHVYLRSNTLETALRPWRVTFSAKDSARKLAPKLTNQKTHSQSWDE